jgi:hypothetical protein
MPAYDSNTLIHRYLFTARELVMKMQITAEDRHRQYINLQNTKCTLEYPFPDIVSP